MTSFSLARNRLFAHVVGSPRRSFASPMTTMLRLMQLPGRGELAGLRPATRVLIIGLVAWIGLVCLVTVIAVACAEVSTMSLPAWFGTRASASPKTAVRSSTRFDNILQRPLFSRSRQGAPVAVATAPPPPSVVLDQNITLKGVFMSGGVAKAFLTSGQDPLGVWVQVGEEVAGWRIVAIKPDQILLTAQNQKLVIPLVNGTAK